jgi:uncharacterized membrane protein YdbT with pleckstrin-like domain
MVELYNVSGSRKLYILHYIVSIALFVIVLFLAVVGSVSVWFAPVCAFLVFATWVVTEVHRAYDKYEVNKRTVVHTSGIFRKHSRRIDLFAISDVIVRQTFYQRMMDFGDIHIRLFSLETENVLKNLDNPRRFALAIEKNQHVARGNVAELQERAGMKKGERRVDDRKIEVLESSQEI